VPYARNLGRVGGLFYRDGFALGTLATVPLGFDSGLCAATQLAVLAIVILVMLARDWGAGAQAGVSGFVPQVFDDIPSLLVCVTAVLAPLGLVLVCWTTQELAWLIILVLGFLELAAGVLWICFGGDIVRFDAFLASDLARWCACIMAAASIACMLWAFHAASRRGFINGATLVHVACAFPIAVVSLWALLLWTGSSSGWPSLTGSLFLTGAAIAPFLPLAIAPMSISKLRHR